jgi:hypothetical protein
LSEFPPHPLTWLIKNVVPLPFFYFRKRSLFKKVCLTFSA